MMCEMKCADIEEMTWWTAQEVYSNTNTLQPQRKPMIGSNPGYLTIIQREPEIYKSRNTNKKVGRRSIVRAARVPQPTLNQPTWLQMSWQA